MTIARGHQHRAGRRLVLDIDDETFSEIQAYAKDTKTTVSQAVRDLVEFGLEAAAKPRVKLPPLATGCVKKFRSE